MAALWSRVGSLDGTADGPDDGSVPHIPLEQFDGVVALWIANTFTNTQALNNLVVPITDPQGGYGLTAPEQTEANRYKVAMNQLPEDGSRSDAHNGVRALINMRELGSPDIPDGDAVQQEIIAYFAEQGITY